MRIDTNLLLRQEAEQDRERLLRISKALYRPPLQPRSLSRLFAIHAVIVVEGLEQATDAEIIHVLKGLSREGLYRYTWRAWKLRATDEEFWGWYESKCRRAEAEGAHAAACG